MLLLTRENLRNLPPIYSQENKGLESVAQVKFFCPWSNWTWYATEYDPEEKLFFGLVDGFEKELGYFSLTELESIRGPGGLRIERDMHWTPTKLKDLMEGKNG